MIHLNGAFNTAIIETDSVPANIVDSTKRVIILFAILLSEFHSIIFGCRRPFCFHDARFRFKMRILCSCYGQSCSTNDAPVTVFPVAPMLRINVTPMIDRCRVEFITGSSIT